MRYWYLWLIAGVISVVGGVLALANPLAATLTSVLLAGYMFIVVGVVTLVSAFGDQGWGGRILSILLGLLVLFFGISLVGHPLAGMISLTYLAAILLLTMGVIRIALALSSGIANLRMALILSGALSLIMGIMIFSNWPQSAAVVLGVFLGVDLISNGVWLIMLSLARKADTPA